MGVLKLRDNAGNLISIRGAQGPKGDKGDKGDQGIQGPAGNPGYLQKISEIITTVDGATVEFTGLTGLKNTYTKLVLHVSLAISAADIVCLQYNGLTGSVYSKLSFWNSTGGASSTATEITTHPNADGGPTVPEMGIVTIDPANSNTFLQWIVGGKVAHMGGFHNSYPEVSSMKFYCVSASNIKAGAQFRLYGVVK